LIGKTDFSVFQSTVFDSLCAHKAPT